MKALAILVPLVAACSHPEAGSGGAGGGPSAIAIENQREGDPGWRLGRVSPDVAGFAGRQSYRAGDLVDIHAAAASTTRATWDLYRLGYYGGAGARHVAGGGPLTLPAAAAPLLDAGTGRVDAPWATTFTIALPADALDGVYLVKLSAASGESYVIFVVRESGRRAALVWPLAFNTYQAYNAWGGTSLYDNRRSDWQPWHAYAASFDRPYAQGNGAGQLFFADRDFITFAEGQGWDLGYLADADVDAAADELAGRRLVLLQGHAEYWSAGERAALAAAIAAGTSVAVLGANDLFWQVRYAPHAGVPRRVLIGYKDFASRDPAQHGDAAHVTTEWRKLGLPENALLGEMFGAWQWSSAPLLVADPWAWLWRGADVANGTLVPGLYGFEVDHRFANGSEPRGVIDVGYGGGENHSGQLDLGQATLYPAPSGAFVFDAGTVSWSQALAQSGRWDRRVQQATHNLVAQLGGAGEVGAAPLPLKLPAGAIRPDYVGGVAVATVTTALTAPAALALAPNGDLVVADGDRVLRVTAAGAITPIAGGAAGDADGAPGAFRGPRGLCVDGAGRIFVADTGNHKLKVIAGGVVRTLAGSTAGYAEGSPGRLNLPMALGCHPAGVLLVADANNMRVRALWPDGSGLFTWAGDGRRLSIDGPGAAASFYFPFALAVFPDGAAAVAESGSGLLRCIAADGAHTVTSCAGAPGRRGWDDGPLASASVSELIGLAARPGGDLVLLDAASYRVRLLGGGRVVTLAGGQSAALRDGDGAGAGFALPRAAVFAADDTLYLVDTGNHALRRLHLP